MDLEWEMRALKQADFDIEAAKRRVGRQREIIHELSSGGHSITAASELLQTLQETLMTMQDHRVLIKDRIAQLQRGGR